MPSSSSPSPTLLETCSALLYEPLHSRLPHLWTGGVPAVELIEAQVVAVALEPRRNAAAALVDWENAILSAVRQEHLRLAVRCARNDEARRMPDDMREDVAILEPERDCV